MVKAKLKFKNPNSLRLLSVYTNKGRVNPILKKLIKSDADIPIPKGLVVDKINKTITSIFNKKGRINKSVRNIILSNPQRLKLNSSEFINLETDKIIKRSTIFVKDKIKKKYRDYEINNGLLYKKKTHLGEKLFLNNKHKNENLVVYNIYNYVGENEPTNIDDFIKTIGYDYNQDFTYKDKTRPIRRVLLKFGRIENGEEPIFRWFPLDSIKSLEEQIENFDEEVFGSDTTFEEQGFLVSLDRLDMSYFRIGLTGSTISAGADLAKVSSNYWYCIQPKTQDNLCLEGAIKKFLSLKERTATMRYNMGIITKGQIEYGKLVPLKFLYLYETLYEVNINVFEDTQHYQQGKQNANQVICSEGKYEKTMSVLFKDNHINLILKPKLKIKELNAQEKRELGVYKKPIKSYVEMLKKKEKKGLKEIVVVFDNETIFDRYDENYLKVYGVSWLVWDLDENHFDYNNGWNEDKTDNKYNHPPYCYYESGNDCLRKLVKFLLNPPQGCIYRPIGFNNSRFDNFSLCDVAKSMGVLTNLFLADGSILYCALEGTKNVWDASRFLIGCSLDTACKSYNTNPRKEKDLINHYEIQCYFEKNGMDGLVKLLNDNPQYILYNKLDCLCLLDLVQKMRGASQHLFKVDIFDSLTLSSMGYKICDEKWSGEKEYIDEVDKMGLTLVERAKLLNDRKDKFNIIKPKTYQDDLFFRKSLTAGRTQSFFGRIDLKLPLAMGDIKSLYPTVMGCYGGNDCPMPYGNYLETKEYQEGKLGIYKVNLIHQRTKWKNKDKMDTAFKLLEEATGKNLYKEFAPNVIPHRVKDCALDWDYKKGIKNIHLTSVDIEVLKWATEDNSCIEVIEGFYWEDSRKDLFLDFLDPPKLEKTRQDWLKANKPSEYNEAIRELCKGISNALSGKLLEAIHEDTGALFTIKNWIKMEKDTKITSLEIMDFGGGFSWINGKKSKEDSFNSLKTTKKKPSYLGMFIYSYARRLMYKKILCRYLTLYMDTDSACMPLYEWERLCYENNNKLLPQDCLMEVDSGEYGCIEEEVCSSKGSATRLIAISPKNYLVENIHDERKSKRKMKGVRKTDYYLPLDYFGKYTYNIEGKAEGQAVDKIRSMTQDEIRRYREFGCCVDCINNKLNTIIKYECSKCDKYQTLMKKCYSTEMFEYMVKKQKIAIFCSMINRIKYKEGSNTNWEFSKNVSNLPSVEEMETIFNGNSIDKQSIIMKVNSCSKEQFNKQYTQFKLEYPKFKNIEQEKSAFVQHFQRYKDIEQTKELNQVFKLQQKYLIKII
jgi:hypothetical protein